MGTFSFSKQIHGNHQRYRPNSKSFQVYRIAGNQQAGPVKAVDTLLTLIENPAHPPIKKIFNCELKNRGSSVQTDNNKK